MNQKTPNIQPEDEVLVRSPDGYTNYGSGWKTLDEVEEEIHSRNPNTTGNYDIFVKESAYHRPHPEPHTNLSENEADLLAEITAVAHNHPKIKSVSEPRKNGNTRTCYRGGLRLNLTASEWDFAVTLDDSDISRQRNRERWPTKQGFEPIEKHAERCIGNLHPELIIVGADRTLIQRGATDYNTIVYFRLPRSQDPKIKSIKHGFRDDDALGLFAPEEQNIRFAEWFNNTDNPDGDLFLLIRAGKAIQEGEEYYQFENAYTDAEVQGLARPIIERISERFEVSVDIVSTGQVCLDSTKFTPIVALSITE